MRLIAALCSCCLISGTPVSGQIQAPDKVFSEFGVNEAEAKRSAAELLSRYLKEKDGNFLSLLKGGSNQRWVESRGLSLSRVTPYFVTSAGRANGIKAIHIVHVDALMWRTYDSQTNQWSQWRNGRHLFIPTSIKVSQTIDGRMIAESAFLSQFTVFKAKGEPDIIPQVREREIEKLSAVFPIPLLQKHAPPREDDNTTTPNPMEQTTHTIVIATLWFALMMFMVVVVVGAISALIRIHRKQNRTSVYSDGIRLTVGSFRRVLFIC